MNRVVVFGSRTWTDWNAISTRIRQLPTDWIIVHGACPTGADAGADVMAALFGRTVERYPADWAKHGNAAGPLRNEFMANLPEVVLGIGYRMPGKSNGTDGMRRLLEARSIPVERYGWGWA